MNIDVRIDTNDELFDYIYVSNGKKTITHRINKVHLERADKGNLINYHAQDIAKHLFAETIAERIKVYYAKERLLNAR